MFADLDLKTLLPLFIPILILQLGLQVYALLDLRKRKRVRVSKVLWLVIIVFGQMIGPIVYLVVGRLENQTDDQQEE